MSVQPWSQEGSTITSLARPWTGVVHLADGSKHLVYCDAVCRSEANPLLSKCAEKLGGQLVVSLAGYHQKVILRVF